MHEVQLEEVEVNASEGLGRGVVHSKDSSPETFRNSDGKFQAGDWRPT